jgi:hypothetical protein
MLIDGADGANKRACRGYRRGSCNGEICDVWMSDVDHADGLEASGMPMDRNEYLRRARALELRAAEFVCSGLRAALLNVAARYRSLANQAVAPKADGKRERLQAVARQNAASEKASGATVQEPARIGMEPTHRPVRTGGLAHRPQAAAQLTRHTNTELQKLNRKRLLTHLREPPS